MPRNPDGSHSISTIADLLEDPGASLHVYCHGKGKDGWGCHHSAKLDLTVLAAKLGPEHGILAKELKPYFHCGKCGSKDISFRIGHDGIKRG